MTGGQDAGPFAWASAARPLAGQERCGDVAVVVERGEGILAAVIDGLGHGDEAADAAELAAETICSHPGEGLVDLLHRCHELLQRTRGAVIAIAEIAADGSLSWTGVGDVEAVVIRGDGAREHALLLGGVVGMQLPRLRPRQLRLEPGDWVIMATDGIARGFTSQLRLDAPGPAAQRILERHAVARDDALVLVARYGGEGP